jgi:hypothetical protein
MTSRPTPERSAEEPAHRRLERDLHQWETELSAPRRFRWRDIKKWLHWVGRSALAPERFL